MRAGGDFSPLAGRGREITVQGAALGWPTPAVRAARDAVGSCPCGATVAAPGWFAVGTSPIEAEIAASGRIGNAVSQTGRAVQGVGAGLPTQKFDSW